MAVTFQLSGMHCGACVSKVTKALQPLAGAVEVSLNPQQVSLKDTDASLVELQAALSAVGKYRISALGISESEQPWLRTYFPLLLILAFILGASLLLQLGLPNAQGKGLQALSWSESMRYFMAGFFLVFSFFKLLDIAAFAKAYQSYDLLAARWPTWGFVYPFVELALGAAYLSNWMPVLTNVITLLVMGFSALGVVRAVLNKSQIQCACLGTVFKLPMSTVTIIEDLGMAMMAGGMLVAALL